MKLRDGRSYCCASENIRNLQAVIPGVNHDDRREAMTTGVWIGLVYSGLYTPNCGNIPFVQGNPCRGLGVQLQLDDDRRES